MARRGALALALAAVALGLAAHALLAPPAPAEAYNFKGPLTGSEVCTYKPLIYLIYPLCDPVYLVSPLYCGPILLIVANVLVTTIQLLIPATQPDEDLR